MTNSGKTTFQPYLTTGLTFAILGWGGLAFLVWGTLPTLGPRWLFFFLLLVAVIGTALPVTYYLNRRFSSQVVINPNVVLRQAVWIGIYVDFLAWLQIGRVLNSTLAFFLAAGFFVIEVLIRMRERSQFKPSEQKNE
jgi:hypothetical protein